MQDEARTSVSGLFESIIVERRRFCVSKKCDHWKRACFEAGIQTASGMRSHVTVSGRPQKQKAQIKVLENLLETEHAIAFF